jgi:hypothetical protein
VECAVVYSGVISHPNERHPMNITITATEANKMMAKSAISMVKDSLRLYFSNVSFTYKTSTKNNLTTLVITYNGDLDIARFSDTLDASEASYLEIFYKADTTRII